jgi:hypothetical protein
MADAVFINAISYGTNNEKGQTPIRAAGAMFKEVFGDHWLDFTLAFRNFASPLGPLTLLSGSNVRCRCPGVVHCTKPCANMSGRHAPYQRPGNPAGTVSDGRQGARRALRDRLSRRSGKTLLLDFTGTLRNVDGCQSWPSMEKTLFHHC